MKNFLLCELLARVNTKFGLVILFCLIAVNCGTNIFATTTKGSGRCSSPLVLSIIALVNNAPGSDCSGTISNAGADQTNAATCSLTNVSLAGNTAANGTGEWTILSGAGVTNHQINFCLAILEKGKYTFLLHNQQGQQIMQGAINHPGGPFNQIINLNKSLPAGIYYLQIAGGTNTFNLTIFID